MRKSKVIGTVVPLSGDATGGYVVHLYRYPNSRTLPHLKILTDHGRPYTSRLAALNDLGAYQRGELVLGATRMRELAPVSAPLSVAKASKPRKPRVSTKKRLTSALEALDLNFDAPPPLPVVTKMPEPTTTGSAARALRKQKQSAALDRMVRASKIKITKLGTARREGDSRPTRKIRANMAQGLYC